MASALRQRVVTALLLGVLVIVVLTWLAPGVAVAAILLAVGAGAWEWAGFAGLRSHAQRAAYLAAIGVAVAIAWQATRQADALRLLLVGTAAWWLIAFAWLMFAPARGHRWAAAVAGFAVLVPAAVGLGRLVLIEPRGQALLLFLLVLVAAADIGAYFGGRRFGRHKLAPQVSPGKTWEGLAAGMIAAALAAVAGAQLFGQPLGPWLAVCVPVSLLSVVGDLAESMFKRQVGLKDSSGLLPGHGGVLDRLDSLTAAGPAFLLGLQLIGVAA